MATLRQVHSYAARRMFPARRRDRSERWIMPRRCMLISASIVLAGLTIPLLMALNILPASFALGLLGWALTATGGTLALIRCGEI